MFQCENCHKSFRTKQSLAEHIRSKHDKRPCGECNICRITFFSRWGLKRHMNTHTDKYRHTCDVCGLGCHDKDDLACHKSNTHGAPKAFKCETCGKTFSRRFCAQRHTHTHKKQAESSPPEHKCKQCGKVFREKRYLKQHYQKHSSERKYVCDTCGSSFKWRTGYSKHIKKCKK